MKLSILDMVQNILSSIDSDEVNSFTDTIEAEQVALIIRTSYNEMISTRNWPHLEQLFAPDNSGTSDRPTHMVFPSNLTKLKFIKYNQQKVEEPTRKYFREMKYVYPDEFLYRVDQRNNLLDTVDVVVDKTGIELLIYNNKHPEIWTSFNDTEIVFDSYDKAFGTTLTKANCQAFGVRTPVWNHVDSFVPDLPEEAFSALLAEAKSVAFLDVKQMSNVKAEQKATSGHRWLARQARTARGGIRYQNYGRKGGKQARTTQPLDKTSVS